MNFEVFTTSVELQDIPSYTTNITLEGQTLRLSFLWNERLGKRVLSIKSSTDEVYLQNTILYQNESFDLNSNAVYDDLPYSVTLVKTGDVNKVGNIFNWSKDFILCFSRTVDLDVKKLNVVYGVTTPSTPILPKPFGDWILNQGFTILGDDIRYTGYKTNGIDTYDSFALSSLQDALVKSFLDSDLQQYAAFTTAVEQLIGDVDWVLDPTNNQIVYTIPLDPINPSVEIIWSYNRVQFATPQGACQEYLDFIDGSVNNYVKGGVYISSTTFECLLAIHQVSNGQYLRDEKFQVAGTYNPDYDPNAETEEQKTLPLDVVAQKVISNAESSVDEVLKLLSEDFINLVANSVFNSNPSKQFVKLEDLIPQLEANKVLR